MLELVGHLGSIVEIDVTNLGAIARWNEIELLFFVLGKLGGT
jgi:hypothetical protein